MKTFKSKKNLIENSSLSGLTPCLSGHEVLKQGAQSLMYSLRQIISASEHLYHNLYLNTIHRVAMYCQNMPWKEGNEDYSLLTRQLSLAISAVKLKQGLLLPQNADAEIIAEQEPQWLYAIFSAGLLYQLHRIQDDRRVILYDKEGNRLGDWHPLMGSLYLPNNYFSVQWQLSEHISVVTVMSALVTHFIDSLTIRWLSQNRPLFLLWWNAVTLVELDNVIVNIIEKAFKIMAKDAAEMNIDNRPISDEIVITNTIPLTDNKSPKTTTEKELVPSINELFQFMTKNYMAQSGEQTWLRVQEGLLVCIATLNEFLLNCQQPSLDVWNFVEANGESIHRENDQYRFRYRPKAFEDRRIIDGIIIKESVLDNTWKQKMINTEFQRAVQL